MTSSVIRKSERTILGSIYLMLKTVWPFVVSIKTYGQIRMVWFLPKKKQTNLKISSKILSVTLALTTLNLNEATLNRFWFNLEIQFQSRPESDPTFSDIDFKTKMAWVWTTLKINVVKSRIRLLMTSSSITVLGETLAVFSNFRQLKYCQCFADDCSWNRTRNSSFNLRVFLCRIRLFPTTISKMKWVLTNLIFFRKRRSSTNYKDHIALEKLTIKLGKTLKKYLSCYVVCAGVCYGNGEQTLHSFFKQAWLGEQSLPIYGTAHNG